jgi:hypothetical protein
MHFDENWKYALCRGRLIRRRKVVARTLDYLDTERNRVDTNRRWGDPSAQPGRKRLLDEVRGWYDKEVKKIDRTLDRLNRPSTAVAR